jgi:hypothetical protein
MTLSRVSPLSSSIDSTDLAPYLFMRDAYLAGRGNSLFDGNPPDTPRRVWEPEPQATPHSPSVTP